MIQMSLMFGFFFLWCIGCVEYFASVMSLGVRECVVTVDEVGPSGDDTAFERTHFKMYSSDKKLLVDGK